jgi:uncharacterized protein YggT (Ycf19 family)
MALIDLILNVAALLLWLNWRSLRFDPLLRATPASLVGTLRPAHTGKTISWQYLAGVPLILLMRALLYWGVGAPSGWTARLDLGWVVLPFRTFRTDEFSPFLLYSFLSFGLVMVVAYFWLLVLVVINRSVLEPDLILRLVRLHLGPVARWPLFVQLLLPVLGVTSLWMALHPVLVYFKITSAPRTFLSLIEQGLVLNIPLILTLKYLLPLFLFLHLVLSYVFLGNSPLWEFVSTTARTLLRPLRILPLRVSKFDFAPLIGVAVLFLVLHWLPSFLISGLRHTGRSPWPE